MTALTPEQQKRLHKTIMTVYRNTTMSYKDIRGTAKRLLIGGHSFDYVIEYLNRMKDKAA